ncbi:hypothetical protein B0H10DRAFT_2088533 [Mycena sp. CBHHK59/15]|nr:hypothetical protein B0H10DRAFT_2088533 [Mycena sp. CBHHK59/15]
MYLSLSSFLSLSAVELCWSLSHSQAMIAIMISTSENRLPSDYFRFLDLKFGHMSVLYPSFLPSCYCSYGAGTEGYPCGQCVVHKNS